MMPRLSIASSSASSTTTSGSVRSRSAPSRIWGSEPRRPRAADRAATTSAAVALRQLIGTPTRPAGGRTSGGTFNRAALSGSMSAKTRPRRADFPEPGSPVTTSGEGARLSPRNQVATLVNAAVRPTKWSPWSAP
jgi:hypothetical protein